MSNDFTADVAHIATYTTTVHLTESETTESFTIGYKPFLFTEVGDDPVVLFHAPAFFAFWLVWTIIIVALSSLICRRTCKQNSKSINHSKNIT